MGAYLPLLAGVLCAGAGGELFVRGVVGLARWARVPAGLVAVTFAAFATSSPELAVAVSAATAGTPRVALGDALGSNIANIGLILGLALLLAPLRATRDSLRRDFPAALLAPALIGVFLLDGRLSRLDGLALLGLFAAWLGLVVREARRQRSAAGEVLGEPRHGLAAVSALAGLLLLVAAGRLIVAGATALALALGVDLFVVGATVVAVATSTPELATVLIARLRGHEEVGLGTVLGSNIYNNLFIAGVATTIAPFRAELAEVATALAFGLLTVGVTFPRRDGLIDRRRGLVLVALFAAYLIAIVQFGPAH